MKRTEILALLNAVKPALSTNDLIPVLSMFWFTGTDILAYNDQISIQVPFKSNFVGALPGSVLLAMLNSSISDEVELSSQKGSTANLLVGKTKLKLAYLPRDDFSFFTIPDPDPKGYTLPVDPAEFLTGIESCLRSVGSDVSSPDQLGITLLRRGNTLQLFSTDRHTLSSAEVKLTDDPPLDEGDRVILSQPFCKQMLRLLNWRTAAGEGVDDEEGEEEAPKEEEKSRFSSKAPKQIDLEITDKYALLAIGGGEEALLYGRLIKSDHPLDYEGIYNSHASKTHLKGLVDVPSNLGMVLDRANIIVKASLKPVATHIEVTALQESSRATFVSKSDTGEVTDTLKLGVAHPEVAVTVSPKLMKKGATFFDKFVASEKSIVFKKGKLTYMVSSFRGGG